jgi:hypothetical protein
MTDHNPILPEDARIVRIKDTEYELTPIFRTHLKKVGVSFL